MTGYRRDWAGALRVPEPTCGGRDLGSARPMLIGQNGVKIVWKRRGWAPVGRQTLNPAPSISGSICTRSELCKICADCAVQPTRVERRQKQPSAPGADHVKAVPQHECVKCPPVFGSNISVQAPGIHDVELRLSDVPRDRDPPGSRSWPPGTPGGAALIEPTRSVPGLV